MPNSCHILVCKNVQSLLILKPKKSSVRRPTSEVASLNLGGSEDHLRSSQKEIHQKITSEDRLRRRWFTTEAHRRRSISEDPQEFNLLTTLETTSRNTGSSVRLRTLLKWLVVPHPSLKIRCTSLRVQCLVLSAFLRRSNRNDDRSDCVQFTEFFDVGLQARGEPFENLLWNDYENVFDFQPNKPFNCCRTVCWSNCRLRISTKACFASISNGNFP